jgi:hypothetical protein
MYGGAPFCLQEEQMGDPRIKGQEIEVLLILNGVLQDTITDVRSFEFAPQLEIKEEGYLGEKTNRKDEIFNGVRGRMELHFENKDIFDLMKAVIDRAKRRTPGTQINIKATLNFPNGDRPRVIISDVSFGEIPVAFGARGDYGTVGLDFQSEDLNFL